MKPKHALKAPRRLPVPALLTLLLCGVCFVFYCAVVQLSGGSAGGFLWYLVLSALLIFLPGIQLCTWLLPRIHGAGRIACAYAFGVAFLFLNYAAAGLLVGVGIPLYCMFLLPALLGAVQAAAWVQHWRKRHHTHSTFYGAAPAPHDTQYAACSAGNTPSVVERLTRACSPVVCALAVCLCAGLFVYAFSGVLTFAHAAAAGNMQYHQDMMWSAGNGAAVQLGFPLRDIRTVGGVLHYHFLADAVPGFLAFAGGLLPYDAACFYNYPVVLFVLICAAFAAARAYGAGEKLAAAFPFALLFLQGFGSEVTLNLLRNMNGVAAATALACTVLFLLFWAEQQGFSRKSGVTVRFYIAFALCEGVLLLSKNLYGILIFCAVFAAVLVGGIAQRRWWKAPLLMGGISAALFALCWALLFRFAINNLVQKIWQSALAIPKTLLLWLPLGFVLYLCSLWLSVRGFRQLTFGRLTVNAAVLGGLLAYFLFHHYSASQVYFLFAAILFLWFCALDAAPLLAKVKWGRVLMSVLAAVSLCGALLTLAPVGRTGTQVALRCLGLRPEYPYAEDTVTADDEAAALWLRANMDTGDCFATNRNAKSAEQGEGTWHYYTAMSGQQAFVESWRYAMDYGMDYTTLRHNLEQVSDVIFAQDNTADAFALAHKYGIRYLLVSIPRKAEPFWGAAPVYENASVRIYEVTA